MSWIVWPLLVLALAATWILWRELRAWRQARGKRLITCPETQKPAAVDLDRGTAMRTGLAGHPALRVSDCTRWPERAGCGEECMAQIHAAHDGCRISAMLREWYTGKSCVRCAKEIGPVTWHDHQPGFLNPEGQPVSWQEVLATDLPGVLATHAPLCWDCLLIENFVRKHPERVTLRPGVIPRG